MNLITDDSEVPETAEDFNKNRLSAAVHTDDELFRFYLKLEIHETAIVINVNPAQH